MGLIDAFAGIIAGTVRGFPRGGRIYFVRKLQFIKVGFTTNLNSRMSALKSSSPDDMVLLGSIRARRQMEAQFHQALKTRRHRGEWFRMDQEFIDAIASVSRTEITKDKLALAIPLPANNGDDLVWVDVSRKGRQSRRFLCGPLDIIEIKRHYGALGYAIRRQDDMTGKQE